MEKISGIYCIENLVNNKKYIGKSTNIEKRWNEHKRMLNKNCSDNDCLQKAWNKYGEDNFRFWIIEECDESLLNEREIYCIECNDSLSSKKGYNIAKGGNGGALFEGHSHTELSKLKIGASQKEDKHWAFGKKMKEETRKKVIENHHHLSGKDHPMFGVHRFGKSAPMYGKHHTQESNDKNYLSHIGKKSKNASSLFFGVRKILSKNKISWQSNINVKGKKIYLGTFKLEIDAAKAYNIYVIQNNLPHPINILENSKSQNGI